MPHILEGEIVSVLPNKSGMKDAVRYMVKVELENGSMTYLNNVQESTFLGGMSDYFRRRATATKDDSDSSQAKIQEQTQLDATIGERVYVAFVNGNINKPIIIGYCQHPNQTVEFGNASEIKPQAVFQYLGIRIEVDAVGQLRFIHKGAPKLKFAPQSGGFGVDLPSGAPAAIGGDNNDAIEPADDTEVTLWEMLNEGVFRLRDANGQMFEMDRTKKTIVISNQSLKSTESADGAGGALGSPSAAGGAITGESITWDDDAKSITIASRSLLAYKTDGKSKYNIKGDETHENIGNVSWTIGGDKSLRLSGSDSAIIAGDQKISINGKQETEGIQGVKITSSTGMVELVASGGAKLKMGQGQIAFAGAGAELLDLFDQTLKQMDAILMAIQQLTCIGNLGYQTSIPVNVADFIKAQIEVKKIDGLLSGIKGGV